MNDFRKLIPVIFGLAPLSEVNCNTGRSRLEWVPELSGISTCKSLKEIGGLAEGLEDLGIHTGMEDMRK